MVREIIATRRKAISAYSSFAVRNHTMPAIMAAGRRKSRALNNNDDY